MKQSRFSKANISRMIAEPSEAEQDVLDDMCSYTSDEERRVDERRLQQSRYQERCVRRGPWPSPKVYVTPGEASDDLRRCQLTQRLRNSASGVQLKERKYRVAWMDYPEYDFCD